MLKLMNIFDNIIIFFENNFLRKLLSGLIIEDDE